MKKVLIIAVAATLCLSVNAQKNDKDYTPKKGDLTVAATLGYNSYTDIAAKNGLLMEYEVAAIPSNWANKALMVGFEVGVFVSDLCKLSLGGGFGFTTTPGYTGVPGTIDADSEIGDGSIPDYRAVGSSDAYNYNALIGIERYFNLRVPNLMIYTGARAGFAYASHQVKYDESESLGMSTAETWNAKGAVLFGVEYFITKALYVGVQVDVFSYTYNVTTFKPQEGLGSLDADGHNCGFLSAPTIKLGFKF